RFDVAEQAGSAGMQDPALDLFAFPSVALQKPFDQPPDFSPNHLGNLFVQNNVEAGVAEVESHGEKRIGKGVSLRDQNFRSWRRTFGRKPIRWIRCASSEGIMNPVQETVTIRSISSGFSPARSRHFSAASRPSFTACSMYSLFVFESARGSMV